MVASSMNLLRHFCLHFVGHFKQGSTHKQRHLWMVQVDGTRRRSYRSILSPPSVSKVV
jgi:hypothetical protein